MRTFRPNISVIPLAGAAALLHVELAFAAGVVRIVWLWLDFRRPKHAAAAKPPSFRWPQEGTRQALSLRRSRVALIRGPLQSPRDGVSLQGILSAFKT
jgi:hypothetical protein